MSPIVLFLLSLSVVLCEPITLPSPHEQIIIEQPSGHVTRIPQGPQMELASPSLTSQDPILEPLAAPTQLSRGERMTMETPGFRIGDINEPIEIIPPPIGNWIDIASDQAIQSTNITIPTNTTTNTAEETTVIANNPWSALTGINVTIDNNNQTHSNITIDSNTTSPTWIDIQNQREHQHQRPSGFVIPNARNMTTSETSFNMTIHGNLTSFNLTAHNMTSNHTRGGVDEGWSFMPGGGETYIIGNITGSPINMSITAPNTSVIISTNPNGTVSIHTNITEPTTTPTHPGDTNTVASSAMLHTCLSFVFVIPIMLSSVVVV